MDKEEIQKQLDFQKAELEKYLQEVSMSVAFKRGQINGLEQIIALLLQKEEECEKDSS